MASSIIVNNIPMDLSVGVIINYEQTAPDIMRFEDIFLSECEDFWMTQYDDCNIPFDEVELPCSKSDEVHSYIEEESSVEISVIDHLSRVISPAMENKVSTVEASLEVSNFEGVSLTRQTENRLIGTENEKRSGEPKTDGTQIFAAESPQKPEPFQGEMVNKDSGKSTINVHATVKGSCDKTKMFVRPSSDGKVKQLCCPYCLTLQSKLPRHMANKHINEPDVAKFVALPKVSIERRQIQDNLRKLGLYKWNGNVELNKNELIPSRRPSGNDIVNGARWTTCPYCLGPYTMSNLRHHAARCHKNPTKGQRIIKNMAAIVEGRLHETATTRLAEIMGFMRQDHIVQIVRYDWLLVFFGNRQCRKYTAHYQHNMIRARLRLTGRLLLEIKKVDPSVTDFASIYHVERYNQLVEAIKAIGKFDADSNEFGAPAMASFAVTFMKQIGKSLIAEYIRLRDRENKIETEDFLTYMDSDIDISINKLVAETQSKMRRLKQQNIPTMDDVKKLMRYINVERNACIQELSKKYSDENWFKLGELSIAWIIVFNRRRVGEAQNILMEDFLGRQSVEDDTNEQMMASLSDESKLIASKFKRMKIRGKKGRPVPVLLKPEIDQGINILISHRQAAGVPSDSRYLFELPSSSKLKIKVFDGCQTLRKFSEVCGAQNPTSLRGTNLRKHMATTCVSLELTDTLVSEVAQFMGHSEKIHKETYRQNTIDREVVQMSKILEAAAGKCDIDDGDEEDDCVGGEVWPSDEDGKDSATDLPQVLGAPDEELGDESNMMMAGKNCSSKRKFEPSTIRGEPAQKKFKKIPWTKEEIHCVQKAFAQHFKGDTLPVQSEIEKRQAEDANASIRNRTWQQIKAYVNNQKKKKS